ncbi:MAG: CDP-6-deoxy-delta-3,4-glucoseen reductase [Methylophilaceae bacterium]|jgi:CDP-4-dehydro-6-deoxyglucose reductase
MVKVTIQSSGHVFEVKPSQTVLEAAIESGINLPYGCRTGSCGSCKGKVIAGKVMHDDYQGSAMTDAELAAGNALFCCARPLESLTIDAREPIGPSIMPRILSVRVSKKEVLSPDVLALHLQLPSSERLQFLPGQYIECILKNGKCRAFSIANAPHSDCGLELHLRLVRGGEFTEHVFNNLQETAIIRIEAPFGCFYLRDESNKPIIFAATGTGFAPIKGIIEHMLYNDMQRHMTLYWGGRKPEDLYMDDLCRRWAEHVPTFNYVPVLSKPESDWTGRTGYVQQAITADMPDLSGYEAYVCGLPNMVGDAQKTFAAHGLPQDAFFSEAFTFAPK